MHYLQCHITAGLFLWSVSFCHLSFHHWTVPFTSVISSLDSSSTTITSPLNCPTDKSHFTIELFHTAAPLHHWTVLQSSVTSSLNCSTNQSNIITELFYRVVSLHHWTVLQSSVTSSLKCSIDQYHCPSELFLTLVSLCHWTILSTSVTSPLNYS